jgi:hypothetical protein
LIHASKASKVLKDKIRDEPLFGTDFAMISLLANVGRVGNSMACQVFPISSSLYIMLNGQQSLRR